MAIQAMSLIVAALCALTGLGAGGVRAGDLAPANQPLPVFNHFHQCVAAGAHLYVIGGYRPQVLHSRVNDRGELTPWQAVATIPAQFGCNYGTATVHNGRIYFLGGHTSDPATGKFKMASAVIHAPIRDDGTLGAWTETTPLPGPAAYGAALVAGGRLYYLGGDRSTKVFFAPVQADGSLGHWVETMAFDGNRAGLFAFEYQGALYAVGGGDATNKPTDTVLMAKIKADGQLGKWRRTEPLPEPSAGFVGARIGARVYILGAEPNGAARLVGSLDPAGGIAQWQALSTLPDQASGRAGAVVQDRWIFLTGGLGRDEDGKVITHNEVLRVSLQEPDATDFFTAPLRFQEAEGVACDGGLLHLARRLVQRDGEPLVIEAEQATVLEFRDLAVRIAPDPEASAGFCVEHVKRMEFQFELKTPGEYQVWERVWFPLPVNAYSHIELMDNGDRQSVLDSTASLAKAWHWNAGAVYPLAAGSHRYVFPSPTAFCAGARLDKLVFAPVGMPKPEGLGPAASPLPTPAVPSATVTSRRIKLETIASWRLDFQADPNGGTVKVEWRYDTQNEWTPAMAGAAMVPPSPKPAYLYFRFTLQSAPGKPSPWIQGLELKIKKVPAQQPSTP